MVLVAVVKDSRRQDKRNDAMAVRPDDCLSCSRICVILDAGDQRCQRQEDRQRSELKERRAESKGVGKDSRSALREVAVVRGIGIIACMGQKHPCLRGPGILVELLVRPGCGVFGCFQFPFVFSLQQLTTLRIPSTTMVQTPNTTTTTSDDALLSPLCAEHLSPQQVEWSNPKHCEGPSNWPVSYSCGPAPVRATIERFEALDG